ncbi:hypothetical protein [Sneathiella aquimaris]|uniref:hypothetical protein n=1 Tax=Sneathiella aquimaris TaxID=2599305 RepID=UPI00146E28D9|nr:hypothetical protein [Sneathiella aquimaris]
MKRTGRKKEWSILVFCIFLLGIFPPVLFVFDKNLLVAGLPLGFLYLYGFWAVMILFMAIGARRRNIPDTPVSPVPTISDRSNTIVRNDHRDV